ncbi:hypothetical protein LMG3458_02493 [Achromobacter deleyi]|uniref:Tail tubular protein A n=1 Tax=Achromobacter deleyi TaxID=1353891 RepID=A0A6S6ZWG7_9BURK|nr:hypothetical protein [Achromobacter deleyi]CAB3697986.1 hypothetical protein LMG3458_02493 [Achromobacter deleyi]
MSAITPLSVVNACLKSMGETPLNALDPDHPYVQTALNVLADSNTLEQQVGWWFNTDYVDLAPDPHTGFVYVPADALNLECDNTLLTQRGNRLWDRAEQTFAISQSVTGKLTREIPFNDLPKNVQQMVSLRTQLDFQNSYDADDSKYKKLYAAYNQAYARVRRVHILNQRINMFHSPSAARALAAVRPVMQPGRALYPHRIR